MSGHRHQPSPDAARRVGRQPRRSGHLGAGEHDGVATRVFVRGGGRPGSWSSHNPGALANVRGAMSVAPFPGCRCRRRPVRRQVRDRAATDGPAGPEKRHRQPTASDAQCLPSITMHAARHVDADAVEATSVDLPDQLGAAPSSGRASPAPNRASTTSGSRSSSARSSGQTLWPQRAALIAASPRAPRARRVGRRGLASHRRQGRGRRQSRHRRCSPGRTSRGLAVGAIAGGFRGQWRGRPLPSATGLERPRRPPCGLPDTSPRRSAERYYP